MNQLDQWLFEKARIVPDKEPTYIGRIMVLVVIVCAIHAIVWWA